jgi:hypothetical protein
VSLLLQAIHLHPRVPRALGTRLPLFVSSKVPARDFWLNLNFHEKLLASWLIITRHILTCIPEGNHPRQKAVAGMLGDRKSWLSSLANLLSPVGTCG